jgi:uncharacterized protein (DUF4415 family)
MSARTKRAKTAAPEPEGLYRPIKKLTTVRIDADVLAWLKSKGQGHLSRINDILRREMLADRKR